MSLLRDGSIAYRVTVPHYTFFFAAACEVVGQVEEALGLLKDAWDIVERTRERWSLPS